MALFAGVRDLSSISCSTASNSWFLLIQVLPPSAAALLGISFPKIAL